MNDEKRKPGRLGRGLAALIGDMADQGDPAAAGHSLSVASLAPGRFQPRQAMAADDLEELAASILAHGVLQPIVVRPDPTSADRFEIIAGERRWRAAQKAGLHEVPVLIRDIADADALAIALIENLQRVDLNAVEEADGFRRLIDDHGYTQERLSHSVGKSRSHVANTLRLLGLPRSVQEDIRRGALSAGHGRALLGHADPEIVARQVIARGLNVRQTEILDRATASPRGRPRMKDADTAAVERDLSAHLGLVCRLALSGRGGQLTIRFGEPDQLEGVVRLLMSS